MFRKLKWFIQRGKRGWADEDTWEFNLYLAKVISGGVKKLKKDTHGFPSCVSAERDWDKILDKIIKTFEDAILVNDDKLLYLPTDEWNEELYAKFVQQAVNTNKMWHCMDTRVMTLQESRDFEEGFELFRKYYFNLWD